MEELKEVSKEKHRILSRYFPTWATILGTFHSNLVYVDCFAGAGEYNDNEPGSPIIVLNTAINLIKEGRVESFILMFIEQDIEKANHLENIINATPDSHKNIECYIFTRDAENATDDILKIIPPQWPSFFFVDPYWHPIPIPKIKEILKIPRREVFLNLMWFSINRDLNNPKSINHLNIMFGHNDWQNKPFMNLSKAERELEFLEYIEKQVGAKYTYNFRIRFGQDEKMSSNRTKYYLMHFSNHFKAVDTMKEIMYPLGDHEGAFDYSASQEGMLFSSENQINKLKDHLIRKYSNQNIKISYVGLREETYKLPFIMSSPL